MFVEFRTYPEGFAVTIDPAEVVAVAPARGGLPVCLVRLSGGRYVAVRGTRSQVLERLERTEDIRSPGRG